MLRDLQKRMVWSRWEDGRGIKATSDLFPDARCYQIGKALARNALPLKIASAEHGNFSSELTPSFGDGIDHKP